VNFDFDKATIRPDGRSVLDEAIHALNEEPGVHIAVQGHTDSVGTDAYNERLSERRAHAVAVYLAEGGIASGRMSIEGFGESKPVASNETSDGRAQNRRVEFGIMAK
jgi:OOP family OmpA-OmpF porin